MDLHPRCLMHWARLIVMGSFPRKDSLPLGISKLTRQLHGLSDIGTDAWGHSQASGSWGSDCSDQHFHGQLGSLGCGNAAWIHRMTSLCVWVAAHGSTFFSFFLSKLGSHPAWAPVDLLSMFIFPAVSNLTPTAPPPHPDALVYFSISGATEREFFISSKFWSPSASFSFLDLYITQISASICRGEKVVFSCCCFFSFMLYLLRYKYSKNTYNWI